MLLHSCRSFSRYMAFFFFFFLFLFSSVVLSKNHCPTSYCPNNSLPIQHPFKLQSQQITQNCSYTNLRCSNQGIAILDLPHNGHFYIRDVDYTHSLIKLYDPENCLPKRLMSLNRSSLDPLLAISYLNYTFYSCPSELIALSNFTAIDCLSNSSIATFATHTVSREVMEKLYRCNEIVTSSIPVTRYPSDFIGNQNDFILRWFAPYCENCPHMTTGLVTNYTLAVAFAMIWFLTIIMPLVICIGCCVHFIRMFRKDVTVNSSNVT